MVGVGQTLLEAKLNARARDEHIRAAAARKRNCVVLILEWCVSQGWSGTVQKLQTDSGIQLGKWQAADNIDLPFIIAEFEQSFADKYGKPPKLVRAGGGLTNSLSAAPGAQGHTLSADGSGNSSGGSSSGGGGGAAAAALTAIQAESAAALSAAKAGRAAAHKNRAATLPQLPQLAGGLNGVPSALPLAYRGAYSDAAAGAPAQPLLGAPQPESHSDRTTTGKRSSSSNSGASSGNPSRSGGGTAGATAAADELPRASSASAAGAKKSASKSSSGGSKTRAQPEESATTGAADFSVHGTRTASQARDYSHSAAAAKQTAPLHQQQQQQAALPAASPPRAPAAAATSSHAAVSSGNGSGKFDLLAHMPSSVDTSVAVDDSAPGGDPDDYFETRLLAPLPSFGSAQLQELAMTIQRDILTANPGVRWSTVVELHAAKQLLQEAVVMPLRFPQFFTGLLSPWKGVLLYGAPGTGKTMLARAVATECKTTFFNISASSIVSKYRGDSEKLVRVLFELARFYAPSTIFIDEIDALMGRRDGGGEGGGGGEHEGSRRMKTELLTQMDGLARSDALVFVLAASNLPWDLDVALLRRLEKRILVPLPNERARLLMLKQHLGTDGRSDPRLDYDALARRTDGYSGADLLSLAKEAAMRPVRRLMRKLMQPHDGNAADAEELDSRVEVELVSQRDVDAAVHCTRPSAALKFIHKYDEWHKEYGATIEEAHD